MANNDFDRIIEDIRKEATARLISSTVQKTRTLPSASFQKKR